MLGVSACHGACALLVFPVPRVCRRFLPSSRSLGSRWAARQLCSPPVRRATPHCCGLLSDQLHTGILSRLNRAFLSSRSWKKFLFPSPPPLLFPSPLGSGMRLNPTEHGGQGGFGNGLTAPSSCSTPAPGASVQLRRPRVQGRKLRTKLSAPAEPTPSRLSPRHSWCSLMLPGITGAGEGPLLWPGVAQQAPNHVLSGPRTMTWSSSSLPHFAALLLWAGQTTVHMGKHPLEHKFGCISPEPLVLAALGPEQPQEINGIWRRHFPASF